MKEKTVRQLARLNFAADNLPLAKRAANRASSLRHKCELPLTNGNWPEVFVEGEGEERKRKKINQNAKRQNKIKNKHKTKVITEIKRTCSETKF